MAAPNTFGPPQLVDDVVGVEVTIDGMLVLADLCGFTDFPPVLGIRPNIAQEALRDLVWTQVSRDLAAQQVLDVYGRPHPTVAQMIGVLARPDRTLEGRWWRRDAGEVMLRFAICRRGDRQLVAVRDDDMLVLQLMAGRAGLTDMVTAVLGAREPADVEPLTGLAAELNGCRTAAELVAQGISPASARVYAEVIDKPDGWVELTAGQRHAGGTSTRTDVAAGLLDSPWGRLVSIPRRIGGELYGSFLPGDTANLQRALDGLLEFLPAGGWLDDGPDAESSTSVDPSRK
ncbi:ESX secretion-associated protein EspG [Mycolicibacterium sp. S2-37]|uniref:ESX secretion-associated protein EspG n=1 Tax=Mycolicibacterium sp. S2-37 TaxID=2810297 RepID=UPI001A93E4E2|nr:ESX secretion-associated protein EspG [Mycolicibacterium sp. S2-37]MBO0677342.1 ESX secretion-associated protein EspG [Mycolicibacterium sp. S2-37]